MVSVFLSISVSVFFLLQRCVVICVSGQMCLYLVMCIVGAMCQIMRNPRPMWVCVKKDFRVRRPPREHRSHPAQNERVLYEAGRDFSAVGMAALQVRRRPSAGAMAPVVFVSVGIYLNAYHMHHYLLVCFGAGSNTYTMDKHTLIHSHSYGQTQNCV